ncbi:formyltransferase [Methylobacterium oxalidis]|uniref:Tungsten-containing formylmethanofuran dehydrogenase subunit B n=2 Tax=Methylobacterium oxalidis TaxID=944322 RepID=A0A512J4L2_9HYPH|nr:formyltransferase [Methylobacterium oxalidis]GEP04850.1 tungsten-containing formylmethanofuran dehydrogenase subunit B [Methylobacterium oxalidis]GLS66981.1 tungsten-containing formylmethanofuran dehydrogenase subunit B [Methylobacterium oxalidis]
MGAWVKGGATDAGTAIEAAASLLAAARAPVVAGLSADLAAVRAAFHLAAASGASLDTAGAAGTYAELGALSRTGAMTTTPAEAVGRADLVLVVGQAPWRNPLLERLAAAGPSRGRAAGAARGLVALGGPPGAAADAYAVDPGGLAVSLAHLRAFAKGHLAGDAPYADLARRLYAAQFGVALYDPAEIGEMGVEMLQGLVKEIDETTRFFALAVSGAAGQDRAVVQLSAWTTGQAPRVGFGRGLPEHDPWRFDAARQAAAGESDAALWLSALPSPRPDWLDIVPTVALVGAGSPEAAAETAEIVIAVAVPGESADGVLWNEGRAALTYHAAASAGAGAPSAAEVLGRIRDRLTEQKGA